MENKKKRIKLKLENIERNKGIRKDKAIMSKKKRRTRDNETITNKKNKGIGGNEKK